MPGICLVEAIVVGAGQAFHAHSRGYHLEHGAGRVGLHPLECHRQAFGLSVEFHSTAVVGFLHQAIERIWCLAYERIAAVKIILEAYELVQFQEIFLGIGQGHRVGSLAVEGFEHMRYCQQEQRLHLRNLVKVRHAVHHVEPLVKAFYGVIHRKRKHGIFRPHAQVEIFVETRQVAVVHIIFKRGDSLFQICLAAVDYIGGVAHLHLRVIVSHRCRHIAVYKTVDKARGVIYLVCPRCALIVGTGRGQYLLRAVVDLSGESKQIPYLAAGHLIAGVQASFYLHVGDYFHGFHITVVEIAQLGVIVDKCPVGVCPVALYVLEQPAQKVGLAHYAHDLGVFQSERTVEMLDAGLSPRHRLAYPSVGLFLCQGAVLTGSVPISVHHKQQLLVIGAEHMRDGGDIVVA